MASYRSGLAPAEGDALARCAEELEGNGDDLGLRYGPVASMMTILLGRQAQIDGWLTSTEQPHQDVQRALTLARVALPRWGCTLSSQHIPQPIEGGWMWGESHSATFHRFLVERSVLRDPKGHAVDKGPHEVWTADSSRSLPIAICRAIIQVVLNSHDNAVKPKEP